MVRGIEEISGPQVLVALDVVCVEAICLDRQLDRRLCSEVEDAVVALEAALDRLQAPHAADAELDARALGIDPPAAALDGGPFSRVGRSGAQRCLLSGCVRLLVLR